MSNSPKVIYGHDPLCGWCYGVIPAFRAFHERHPEVPVEVVGGGLFSGERVQPYQNLREYIPNAFSRVTARTGQVPGEAFLDHIVAPTTGLVQSAPPTHALAQIGKIAPARQAEFAHALQEAHFVRGLDFNKAGTYDTVTDELGLPRLDTDAIVAATDDDPLVAAEYARSRSLGISSYPTVVITDDAGRELGRVDSTYDPEDFVAEFERIAGVTESA